MKSDRAQDAKDAPTFLAQVVYSFNVSWLKEGWMATFLVRAVLYELIPPQREFLVGLLVIGIFTAA